MKERINPVGLKGNQITERMRELMGVAPINENRKTSVIELTKRGPDGNIYGIVRENHEYYIKIATKTENITAEDFAYIGGLQNKKKEAHHSYAKAIKHLNLKFNSLNEAYGKSGQINVFEDDNLVEGIAGFYSPTESMFKNEGNLDGHAKSSCCDAPIMDEMCSECGKGQVSEAKTKDNPWAICTSSVGREDKAKYEKCVKDVKKEKGIDENITEAEFNGDVTLSEVEQDVEDMMEDEVVKVAEAPVKEHRLSIARSIEGMDDIIESVAKGTNKKKVYTLK
jgi:hypothetical protein